MSKYDPDNFDDTDLLSALKEEEKFTTNNRDRHDVKLEKEGEMWHIRFLPARFGPRKLFFLRVAQHWINKRPHFCEKASPVESGGDANARCELCEVAEELSNSGVKDVAALGYKAGANPQWLTYCLVWSKKAPNQDLWEPQGEEAYIPHKFWLNKTLFEELREYYLRQRDKKPNIIDSILNPDHGFDFYVKRSNNKLVLQKDDPRTIFPEGFNEDEKRDLMGHILGQIKAPNYRPLSGEEMEAARIKLEDAARKLEMGGGTSTRRSSRSSQDDDETELPARSTTRPARQAPPTPRRQAESESESVPSRPSPPTRPAPPRLSPPTRAVPSARPQAQAQQDPEDDVSFGSGPAESEPAPSPSSRLRQASRQAPPPAKSEAPQRSSNASSVDDDDDVTDEPKDQAPPADDFVDEAPPAPVTKVQTPAPTPAPQARPVSKMSERLRGAIQRTQQ